MRHVLPAILLLAALLPHAAAQCAGPVCIQESSSGDGCPEEGSYAMSSTTVDAAGQATLTGSSYCFRDPENGEGSGSSVAVSAAGRSLLWGESNGACFLFLYSGEDVASFPCAAAPPNPGWGHLLA